VAADSHKLMTPQSIMRPSTARTSKRLDPRCSQQTYHRTISHTWPLALSANTYFSFR